METTLRDMGYTFDYINLQEYQQQGVTALLKAIRRKINRHVSYAHFAKSAMEAVRMLNAVDEVNELYYRVCGVSTDPAGCKKVYQQFLKDMYAAVSREDIEKGRQTAMDFLEQAPRRTEHPLRVGLIGEYYTVMDPPSNLYVEQKLADMGVSVERWMNLSSVQLKREGGKNLGVGIRDILRYSMGPTSI